MSSSFVENSFAFPPFVVTSGITTDEMSRIGTSSDQAGSHAMANASGTAAGTEAVPTSAAGAGGDEHASAPSLRLSCNRCRLQKLKCSVSAESNACQRCSRARVPCVFGRRAPSKRTNKRNISQPSTTPPSPQLQPTAMVRSVSSFTPPPPPLQPPPPSSESGLTASTADTTTSAYTLGSTNSHHQHQHQEHQEQQHHLAAAAAAASAEWGSVAWSHGGGAGGAGGHSETRHDAGPTQPTSWETTDLALDTLVPNLSDGDSSMTGYDWLHSRFSVTADGAFDVRPPFTTPWPQRDHPMDSESDPSDGITPGRSSSGTDDDGSLNMMLINQHLANLVVKLQRQLKKLKEGPWHNTDSLSSLHDYPVGKILEMSQQFRDIAGSLFHNAPNRDNRYGDKNEEDIQDEAAPHGATADTPTMLLLMCGYLWLVRTYDHVLGHFQHHLGRTSRSFPHLSSPTHSNISRAGGPSFRLGELPCSDIDTVLHQVSSAVRMLLECMQDIEHYLGRGALVNRNIAVSLLLDPDEDSEDSTQALNRRADAVKELLRERLGL